MCRFAMVLGISMGFWLVATKAPGQSLQDRIARVRRQRATVQQLDSPAPQRNSIGRKLGDLIERVEFDANEAKEAFQWWSQTSDIPLVIDWNGLELEAIDSTAPITLRLRNLPAGQVLALLIRQIEVPGVELIIQSTPWYMEVMTKTQANRQTVIRVYDVRDLLYVVPNFTNPPDFDLNEALSNTSSGGSGGRSGGRGGSSGSLFGDSASDDEAQDLTTRAERVEELAQLIRNSIEPDIWQLNGGEYASIRYLQGRLIVNAPQYVHDQIGVPTVSQRRVPRSLGTFAQPALSYRPSTAPRFGTMRPRSARRGRVAAVYD